MFALRFIARLSVYQTYNKKNKKQKTQHGKYSVTHTRVAQVSCGGAHTLILEKGGSGRLWGVGRCVLQRYVTSYRFVGFFVLCLFAREHVHKFHDYFAM
jgi:hypothetical protein